MSHMTADQSPPHAPMAPAEATSNVQAENGHPNDSPRGRRRFAPVTWLASRVPTVAVLVMFGALGMFGHHYGWKIPKFSELTGQVPSEGVPWCDEHGVPEADCISCNADLMPKGKLHGWCKIHGVHECLFEHPELAQLSETPEISQDDIERAARALAVRPRTENNPTCKMHLRRIQLPTAAAADKAGIDIALVDRGRVVESISVAGEIVYDPTRVARLASRAAGTMWRVDKNVGDRVKKGDLLALVDAVDVGRIKMDLLQAVAQLHLQDKTLQRLAGLGQVVAGKRLLEAEAVRTQAEAVVRKSVQALQNLGLPISLEKDVHQKTERELGETLYALGLPTSLLANQIPEGTATNLLPIVAPRDGIVVSRDIVAGEVIDTTKALFIIADTSRMWLMLSVPLEEAEYVSVGQKVAFMHDGSRRPDLGTLTWISTTVDARTRTIKVRGELPNADGHLRNEIFGTGNIVLREEPGAIVVPSNAVHWEGCCHIVFVRDKNYMKEDSYKVFHTRSVRPGIVMGDTTEMIAGLLPDEVIVTLGSGVLRAELLKGNLGAG